MNFFDAIAPATIKRDTQFFVKPKLMGHSSRDVLDLIKNDLFSLSAGERRTVRYFSFANAAARKISPTELRTQQEAFVKLLNSVSWGKELAVLEAVDREGLVVRVKIDQLKWDSSTWDRKIVGEMSQTRLDAYATREEQEFFADNMRTATSPFVNADAFVATVSKAEVYNDLMGLGSLSDLLRNLGFKRDSRIRAGFSKSGVSNNNRVIERYDTDHGYLWISRDFKQSDGRDRRNIFDHPTDFSEDGGEVIFSLPNGTQGYMIVNERGQAITKAPIQVVSDPRRPDRAVENGISCMRCHAGGLLVASDEIKNHGHLYRAFFSDEDVGIVEKLHADNDRLKALIKQDTEKYQAKLRQMNPEGQLDPITPAVSQFEKDVTLETALADSGLLGDELAEVILAFPERFRPLLPLLNGKTIPRDTLNLHIKSLYSDHRRMLAFTDDTLSRTVRVAVWLIKSGQAADQEKILLELGRRSVDLTANDVVSLIQNSSTYQLRTFKTSFFPKVAASERNLEKFRQIALAIKQKYGPTEREEVFRIVQDLFPNPTPSEFESLARGLYYRDHLAELEGEIGRSRGEIFDGLLKIYYPHLSTPRTAREIVLFHQAPFSSGFKTETLRYVAQQGGLLFNLTDIEILTHYLPRDLLDQFVSHNPIVKKSRFELEHLLTRVRLNSLETAETFTFEDFEALEVALGRQSERTLRTFHYWVLAQKRGGGIQVQSLDQAAQVVRHISKTELSYAPYALLKLSITDSSSGSYANLKHLMNLEIAPRVKVLKQPEFLPLLPQLFSKLRESERTAANLADLASHFTPGEKGLLISKKGDRDVVIEKCLDQLTGGSRRDFEALLEHASENQLRKKIEGKYE